MGMLRAGTGSLLSGLQKVSPVLAEQLKATKTNEEAFELIIKAIQKVDDQTKKAYLANLAFGKSGLKMVQLANHGADGLAELRKQAQEMGVVLGEDAVNNSAKFMDALEENSEVIRGLSGAVSSKLLPVIIPIIQSFNRWIMANRDLIATKVDAFVKNFANWLKQVDFKAVGNAISSIISVFGGFIDVITSSKWALIGFIALLNVQTIAALANVALGIGKLAMMIPGLGSLLKVLTAGFLKLGLAILTTPVGWIALGIAAVVAAFTLLWKKCEGFRNFWIGLWDIIKSSFQAVADFIAGGIKAIMNPIDTLMKGIDAIKSAGGWIADKLGFGGDEPKSEPAPQSVPQSSPIPQTLPQTYTPYPAPQSRSKSEVVVKFDNMPREASVEKISQEGQADLGVEYGYAYGGA